MKQFLIQHILSKAILSFLLVLGSLTFVDAQLNAELKVIPKFDSVRVGKPLELKLQLTLPENGQCNGVQIFPDSIKVIVKSMDPEDSTAVSYEVVDYGDWERSGDYNFLPRHLKWTAQKVGTNQVFVNDMKIIVWEPGVFFFPPAKADVTLASGDYEVFSEEFSFLIELPNRTQIPNVDSSGLAPIKTILREGEKSYAGLIASVIGAALLIGGFLYWFANRKTIPVEHFEPPVLAHERALSALQQIERRKDWENNDLLKKYYDELTQVIRRYLEDRYEIKALESTTDEIISDLTIANVPNDIQGDLKKLLPMTDMVKFAKADPSGESHVNWLNWAKTMVETTKQEPEIDIENTTID